MTKPSKREVRPIAVTLRFASVSDFDAAEAVYRERFPTELSVNDAVYQELLRRGGHLRLLEVTYADLVKRVEGFYTFWPLSEATFRKMAIGEVLERSTTVVDITNFDDERAEVLYVPEIAISVGSPFGTVLIKDAFQYACSLLQRCAHFKLIAAWGYSDIGKSMSLRLGMRATSGSGEFLEMSAAEARTRCKTAGRFLPSRTFSVSPPAHR